MTNEEIRDKVSLESNSVDECLYSETEVTRMQNLTRADERHRIIKIITNEMSGVNINKSISTEITTLRDKILKQINLSL